MKKAADDGAILDDGASVSEAAPIYKAFLQATKHVDILTITVQLEDPDPRGVEFGALDAFLGSGFEGCYTENMHWSALFGLAFWDVIFTPLPGAFFNEFQRGPADLSSPDFFYRRSDAISLRLEELTNGVFPAGAFLKRYDEKQNIANAFVNWKRFERPMLEAAVERIPAEHIAAVLGRIARNPMPLTTGLPDLILYSARGAVLPIQEIDGRMNELARSPYLLAEVKGSGDQVQRNQRRWLSFFASGAIPAIVVRVEYRTT